MLAQVPKELRADIHLAAQVFPFRVNDYVLRELIDWEAVPDDPMFRPCFRCRKCSKIRIAHGFRRHCNETIALSSPASYPPSARA